MARRVVVTGGAGRIGSWVLRALQHDYDLVLFDHQQPREKLRARVVLGDHTDIGAVCEAAQGAEAILHLSAIPSPAIHPESTVFRTNVLGTYAVHMAGALAGVRCIVSTSSQSAFGWAWGQRDFLPRYLPLDEEHPDEPDDGYGLSKVVGEQIAWSFHRKTGMRTIVLRPPLVTGPQGYRAALASPAAHHWRHTLFSYVDVRDLAQAFRCALEQTDIVCDRFNIVADDALCEGSVIAALQRDDPRLVPLGATLGATQPLVSNRRARELLHWSPAISWRTEIAREQAEKGDS
ncbi:MAG: NAD(P)-dependent oxidoreductase [Chloroflexi bacterium]|nr:NAD(P)-dependent oxidoreductase [Chloroflexota bacterium]